MTDPSNPPAWDVILPIYDGVLDLGSVSIGEVNVGKAKWVVHQDWRLTQNCSQGAGEKCNCTSSATLDRSRFVRCQVKEVAGNRSAPDAVAEVCRLHSVHLERRPWPFPALPPKWPGSFLCSRPANRTETPWLSRQRVCGRILMSLQFHRAVEDMEIWSATGDGFSFVITYETPAGAGFHGRAGYVASWRPLYRGNGAIKIGGSAFATFAEAGKACNTMLEYLKGLSMK